MKCKCFGQKWNEAVTLIKFLYPSSVRSSDWYGLFSFWWKYPGNLLWRWNGELFRALLFAFHLFLFSSSYFFFIVLVAVYLHVGPLSILSGFAVPGRAVNMIWTCSVFCYLNLLKTPSSQHIIPSHRCPSLLESAECGSASSDSAARFTTQTYNTHTGVVCSAL